MFLLNICVPHLQGIRPIIYKRDWYISNKSIQFISKYHKSCINSHKQKQKSKTNKSKFVNVTATATFIKLINDVFDILDSRTRKWGVKRTLNMENYEKAFKRLDEASGFILTLKVA